MSKIKSIIQSYYNAFNDADDVALCALLDEDVIHDVNQSKEEVGVEKFQLFLKHMRNCYDEKVYELLIFTDDDQQRASAEFYVKGKYIKTDPPLVEANGQPYDLRVGSFFELKNGKISRVTTYYNLQKWLEMVKA